MNGTKRADGYSFIYVIKSGVYFKVGMAANVENRFRQYYDHNPHAPERVFISKKISNHFIRHIESRALKLLAPYQYRGEWFVTSQEAVLAAVNEAISTLAELKQQFRQDQNRLIMASGHYVANRPFVGAAIRKERVRSPRMQRALLAKLYNRCEEVSDV